VSTHTCPGGCGTQVAQHLFACRPCWSRLPRARRAAVMRGYDAGPLGEEHTTAMVDALDWYAANPPKEATSA
jgi:hypothetical protein